MGKPEPHHGMQTVTFVCEKGDTFSAHGHVDHAPHGHEVRRLRDRTKHGCPAMKLKPGAMRPSKCGAKISEKTVTHAVPAYVPPEPAADPEATP